MESFALYGALALFFLTACAFGLVVLLLAARAFRRRPGAPAAPLPAPSSAPGQVDPLDAFGAASDHYMKTAIYSDLGRAKADEWKQTMARHLGPKPASPSPPPNA